MRLRGCSSTIGTVNGSFSPGVTIDPHTTPIDYCRQNDGNFGSAAFPFYGPVPLHGSQDDNKRPGNSLREATGPVKIIFAGHSPAPKYRTEFLERLKGEASSIGDDGRAHRWRNR